jgi:type IV secretory pathway TraG/TraD family ATPase VirD4
LNTRKDEGMAQLALAWNVRAVLGAVCLIGATLSVTARADTLADLRRPSSTISGCVNDWGALGTGAGVATPTCEGQAALTTWNTHAAAINVARDTVATASNLPADHTDPQKVITTLDAAAAAADAMTPLYHPTQPRPGDVTDVLGWMQGWFERQHLPIPATIGDGLRTLAAAIGQPHLLIADRTALYGQAAIFVTRESQLATDLAPEIQHQTDTATRAAHVAALQAALAVENGQASSAANAAIAAAAGPAHPDLAQGQTRQLDQSLAAHPSQGSYTAQTGLALGAIPSAFLWILGFAVFCVVVSFPRLAARHGTAGAVQSALLFLLGLPLSWLPLALLHAITGFPDGWVAFLIWLVLFFILLAAGPRLLPGRLGRGWVALFAPAPLSTHGSARFGQAQDATAAGHLVPAAPADAFALGDLPGLAKGIDRRFRQDGHILTCAPTGAGKGLSAVIPNLLDYPGSAFVLDFKGENYAVTARARREAGHEVVLVDPFGITGVAGQAMNWLDALNPDDPDVVSLSGALADMLVVSVGETDSHWNDTAKELLRGLLVYVAGLPPERRTMAELRRIVTAPEDEFAEILADMLADPDRGQHLPARAATGHLNRPERERGSVLSTVVRHTAWLDDPRLCAALVRSDFTLADLKRRRVTVYLAIPPDRLRACQGFVRGFIGLALDAMTATPGKPAHRVAFFLDEFGQLGRMDRLADSITLLRGYGVQMWLFVQDLSQLKAVYPRWQSFMANTTQQFFGTADYDTARTISDSLGQHTISFQTSSASRQTAWSLKPGSSSAGTGEHLQGRSLLTPDEVMRLGPTRPIVMIAGEPPYLLTRINYLTDPAYAGRFDPNPMHLPRAVE